MLFLPLDKIYTVKIQSKMKTYLYIFNALKQLLWRTDVINSH